MNTRLLFTFVFVVFCVPCFADELPSVPELIKRMYDYRMSIENMRAEVTVTTPVDTRQPHVEKMKQHYYFAYDKGRIRCEITRFNEEHSKIAFDQHLSTPDFYFLRYPSEGLEINDGNNLFMYQPLEESFTLLDPRGIGTGGEGSFDTFITYRFNYDALLDEFYDPMGENYSVSVDMVDGEKLYKVSCQFSSLESSCSCWFNPQKGYNLVRSESTSETYDFDSNYVVTLGKFPSRKGGIWFPQEISFKHREEDKVLEETVVIDSIAFDVQDETPFTLTDLKIPVGYSVGYRGDTKYWDGKKFVDKITFAVESANSGRWQVFLIVNAVIFALLALLFLYKLLQRRSN